MFCEIKEIVDDQAIGARTVVAADLDGDGWIDLASASKDADEVAWYVEFFASCSLLLTC